MVPGGPSDTVVLFVAPIPPPLTGQSLANDVLLAHLRQTPGVRVVVVDVARPYSHHGIVGKLKRTLESIGFAIAMHRSASAPTVIYYNVSESVQGALKDLFVYATNFHRLDRFVLHLHGGTGMRKILSGDHPLLFRLNRFFVARMRRVIVLGERFRDTYGFLDGSNQVVSVPNFAEERFFRDDNEVEGKHAASAFEVLFLSNLLPGKGYLELLGSAEEIGPTGGVHFHFAGGFASPADGEAFAMRVAHLPHVTYHGFVQGDEKQALLARAQVFALPTYYPYEGQPISILEAYASGCAVVTTDHAGIFDVYAPGVNGEAVPPRDIASLTAALRSLAADRALTREYGRRNAAYARANFTRDHFLHTTFHLLAAV